MSGRSDSMGEEAVKLRPVKLRHRVEMAAYLGLRGFLRLLPHRAARRFGAVLGSVFHAVAGSRREVARSNLAIAFPDLPEAERHRLARRSFQHLGIAIADVLSASRFDLAELCRHVELEGWEHLERFRGPGGEREGRALLVLSGHLGCWEIAAWLVGAYFGPLEAVARPLDNPLLDADLAAFRGRFGNSTIPKRGALRGMMRSLSAGGMVGILIDQKVEPRNGIEIPFFGRPAWTSPVPATLALRGGVPVVPIFCHPLPEGRYRFVARPPILPEGKANDPEAVAAFTRRLAAAVEDEIRLHPDTWLWLHKRWAVRGRKKG